MGDTREEDERAGRWAAEDRVKKLEQLCLDLYVRGLIEDREDGRWVPVMDALLAAGEGREFENPWPEEKP